MLYCRTFSITSQISFSHLGRSPGFHHGTPHLPVQEGSRSTQRRTTGNSVRPPAQSSPARPLSGRDAAPRRCIYSTNSPRPESSSRKFHILPRLPVCDHHITPWRGGGTLNSRPAVREGGIHLPTPVIGANCLNHCRTPFVSPILARPAQPPRQCRFGCGKLPRRYRRR